MTIPWCPFVTRRDGNPQKMGYPQLGVGYGGPKRGDVKHSAEGENWDVIHDLLDSLVRRASWHFTVGYDRVEQHYEISAHTWHAGDTDDDGGVRANIDLIGIEHLGMAGTPLTAYQVEMTARISRWAAEQFGYTTFSRYPQQTGTWTLVEHNQVSDAPTACPSNRIPWGLVLLKIEELEEDVKSTMLVWDYSRQRLYWLGSWGAAWITDPADAAALKHELGEPTLALSAASIDATHP